MLKPTIEMLRADQRQCWTSGRRVLAEEYLQRFPELAADDERAIDLIYSEYLLREELGESPRADEYVHRFPQFAAILCQQFELHRALNDDPSSEPQHTQLLPTADPGHTLVHRQAAIAGDAVPASAPRIPNYQILGEVGRGGMAVVYQALDRNLNRIVALKMILYHGLVSDELRQRFRVEAEAIARLQHPHIVQIYDVGEHDGVPYIVLEYVRGGTLHEYLRSRTLPAREAATLVALLARAVGHAHQLGVLHRDLKPANVLLHKMSVDQVGSNVSTLNPKITDFGLAKLHHASAGETMPQATRSGEILGTPSYMAPEQARGERQAVGPGADIYSLGAILYEALTGRPPFQGETPLDVFHQMMLEDPIPPSVLVRGISRDIQTICQKCLEKNPQARYSSAIALAEDLERHLHGQPILARRTGITARSWKWMRRRPTVAAIIGMICASLLAGLGAVAWHRQRERSTVARELVQALLQAAPDAVDDVAQRLTPYTREAVPLLQAAADNHKNAPPLQCRLQIAQLAHDPTALKSILSYLPESRSEEIRMLIRSLAPYQAEIVKDLWSRLPEPDRCDAKVLPAVCLLAQFAADDPRWPSYAECVTRLLVKENPWAAADWYAALVPVREKLTGHLVQIVVRKNSPVGERILAANILAQVDEQAELLARVMLEVDAEEYVLLRPKLESLANSSGAIDLLRRVALATQPTDDLPTTLAPSDGPYESEVGLLARHARRRAHAAITLAHLNDWQPLRTILARSTDPTARSYLVERAAALQLPLARLIDELEIERDAGSRMAVVLAAGQYPPPDDLNPQSSKLVQQLRDWYHRDADAGLHGAIRWLLCQWNQSQLVQQWDEELRSAPIGQRHWFVNSQGQTYSMVFPAEYCMGSPQGEEDHEGDEEMHLVQLNHTVAFCTREISVAEYHRFDRDAYASPKYTPDPACPIANIDFFQAARYCNWLSERDGIPQEQWCFPPPNQIGPGMELPADYLERTGYRLPLEAEWEFACRAGAETPWCFGLSDDLMGHYGRCLPASRNRSWPGGQLKPNELGIFDMHGNLLEWCVDEVHDAEPQAAFDEKKNRRLVDPTKERRTRSGYFGHSPAIIRSARRSGQPVLHQYTSTGFRPVRTWKWGDGERQRSE